MLERRDKESGTVTAEFDDHHVAQAAVGQDVLIANTEEGELIPLDPDTLRVTGEPLPDVRGPLNTCP